MLGQFATQCEPGAIRKYGLNESVKSSNQVRPAIRVKRLIGRYEIEPELECSG